MNSSIGRYCWVAIAIMATMIFAEDRCVMKFSACPETFNNKTIVVPNNVVGIAPSVLACQDTAAIESTSTTRSSFFFIIDNSSSMTGSGGSDPTGARFTVTQALLDSIYKKQPNAQVGLAVFETQLLFDTSTTSKFWYSKYFKTMSQVYDTMPSQAYMPLLTLNQSYNGVLGINILDSALATTGSGGNITLNYKPNNKVANSTNINIGFLAAREAFANSLSAASNQYIVFLSDGDANRGAKDPGPDSIYYFRDSTRNVPTTFTVFFNSKGSTTIPANIQTMTNNIKNNGYSTSNPSSADYAIDASYNSLSNILLQNVISLINVPAVPVKMVLNNITSNTYTNGQFMFADSFRFASTTTQYTMQTTYRFTNPVTGQTHDSVETVTFSVRHDSTATTPAGINFTCSPLPINNSINAGPLHNPVGPNSPITDKAIINFYQNVLSNARASGPVTGALIGITSTNPLVQRSNGSYGSAVVYDALGNIVAKGLRVDKAGSPAVSDHVSYGVYWDCRNRDGRLVGGGTYLIAISTTDVNNAVRVDRIKIGVSR